MVPRMSYITTEDLINLIKQINDKIFKFYKTFYEPLALESMSYEFLQRSFNSLGGNLTNDLNYKLSLYGDNQKIILDIINDINTRLDSILTLTNNPKTNKDEIYKQQAELSKLIDEVYIISTINIKFDPNVLLNKEQLERIIQEIKIKGCDISQIIPVSIYDTLDINLRAILSRNLIELRNIMSFSPDKEKELHHNVKILSLVYEYISLKDPTTQDNLRKEIDDYRKSVLSDLDLQRKKFTEDMEKAKSGKIITAFKDRSKKAKDYIQILYFAITFLFLTIISSFIFRMAMNTEFSTGSFLYFLSFIIAVSGLLTFVIKEKNRLVDQSDHFEKCHTELEALTTYVVDLDPKRVEDLKIDLAYKYFTGGNNGNTSEKSEMNIPNETIKQFLDLLNTIQKNNKAS